MKVKMLTSFNKCIYVVFTNTFINQSLMRSIENFVFLRKKLNKKSRAKLLFTRVKPFFHQNKHKVSGLHQRSLK